MDDAAPASDLVAHAAFVRRLARSLLADAHGSEDVAQEALRRSLEHPPARGGELRGWLARVARNLAFQRRRAEANRGARERRAARVEALPAAEASLERTEALQRVLDAVRALDEPYRATVLARFYEDLPPRAIAARDGVPIETVNTRLKRALVQLRCMLQRERDDLADVLSLLAGSSPCLPPQAGQAGVALMLVKTLAFLAVGLLAVGVWLWRGGARPPAAGAPRAQASPTVDGAEAPSLEREVALASRAELPPARPPERALGGRVLDEQGVPVAQADVVVMGHADPFAPGDPQPAEIFDAFHGRRFETDADGRWRAVLSATGVPEVLPCGTCHTDAPGALPEPERVCVQLVEHEAYVPLRPAESRWVSAPDEHVDFVVHRRPTGALEVRVVEGATRVALAAFRVRLVDAVERDARGNITYRGVRVKPARDGVWREELAVEDPAGRMLHVSLVEPGDAGAGVLEQDVRLLPGATEQVLFVLPERGVLRGQVVAPDGAPVADAFVYFGGQARARGDEPFKPFRPERVLDGARSGADGWFELRGEGAEVTAGHERFSSVTVEASAASRIVLGARGAVRGVLRDAEGGVLAGVPLRLDDRRRGSEARSDAHGRFAFEGVEAGVHAVWRDEAERMPCACLRLEPGEEAELELHEPRAGSLVLGLPAGEALASEGLRGVIVGRERVFDLREVTGGAAGALSVAPVPRPGRYWLATSAGVVGAFTLADGVERVELELGDAELRVHSSTRRNLQVVPADADPFVRLMAARCYVRCEGGSEGRFRLVPGRYLLVGEAGAVLREVQVPAAGLELRLE